MTLEKNLSAQRCMVGSLPKVQSLMPHEEVYSVYRTDVRLFSIPEHESMSPMGK
jgi:hypothetical protein